MKESLILAFDVSTQSMRASLVTPAGEIADTEQLVYVKPYDTRQPNRA